jgi:cohesin complex subunit SA-1/2
MGFWFKKYPGHFLDGAYLRYVGWVLSDSSTQVRLEAVKSLSSVYQQSEYIVSLNHFTERFKPRLIEMATGDTELAVRVAVIQVLAAIDEQSLLEEDEREKMCLLVFDEEAKVRKAVGRFVKGVWEEDVEERLTPKKKPSDKDKERTGIKVFGNLLVKWGRALDKTAADTRADGDGADKESLSSGEGNSRARNPQVVSLMGSTTQKGRTALAVEALWNEVDSVSDWESLLDVLLLDHSAGGEEGTGGTRGRKGHTKQVAEGSAVDDVWRLEEVEESLLLEALLATLTRARAEVVGAKKVSAVKPVSLSLMRTDPVIYVLGRRGISHI